MEKLLQLLNEYRLEKGMSEYNKYIPANGCFTHKSHYYDHYSWVISKKFGFIQWLVENNKIKRKVKLVIKYFRCNYYGELRDEERYNEIESLLMLLAISDDPISFLVSILK